MTRPALIRAMLHRFRGEWGTGGERRAFGAHAARGVAAAAMAISPLDDLRGSAAYRRQMVQVQVRRTLAKVFDLKVE